MAKGNPDNFLYFNRATYQPDGGITVVSGHGTECVETYTEFTDSCVVPKLKTNRQYLCVIDHTGKIAALGTEDEMKYLATESRKKGFILQDALNSKEYKKINK